MTTAAIRSAIAPIDEFSTGEPLEHQYLTFEQIKVLQVEPTSRCNLACPQCARMDHGKINSQLPIEDLTRDDIDLIFTKPLIAQLQQVLFNGNYGDPLAYPHLDYAIDHLQKHGKPRIFLYTNGSLRPKNWWSELGKKLSNGRHLVIFSIDGLEETNSVYRINSQFSKIMENAQAYINAGGPARWDFLLFQHNHHQVDTAMDMAKKMGFKLFNKKKTARFIHDHHIHSNRDNHSTPIFDKNNKVKGELSPPSIEALSKFEHIKEKYGSWQNYVNQTEINCKYKNDMSGIYVDFRADVWPCCWLGAPKYFADENNQQRQQLYSILNRNEAHFNSLRSHNWADILNHPWFNSELVESWSNTLSDKNAKLMTCGRTCGTDYEFSSGGRWNNSEVIQLDG